MKKAIVFFGILLVIILIDCGKKDPLSPEKPKTMIRLQTGGGLNHGAFIYFIALSKKVDFHSLSEQKDIFEYDKTESDWFIEGGTIPFATDYKKFTKPIGEYYYLLRASGVAMMSQIEVMEGKQTWVISAERGYLNLDIEQP